jgi:RHS repeat-associated protein
VTNGCKYFADGTLVPGQQFGYTFDDIGNRQQTRAGGDSAGSSLRLANYSVNTLNQITSRDYPGTNDILGVALATNSVTVNGQTAWRKGEYFWSTVKTNNTSSAAWQSVTVASGGNTNSGGLFVPRTPEQFSYDADGNLTNDGRWSYTWDAENRLIQMNVNTNVGPQYQLTFAYDAKGRRIQKVVATNGLALFTNNFLYDGWNLIAETKPDNSLICSYVWGTDLSGSMQGAGGVGGLLEMSYYGSSTTNCFPMFDGNGNVAALVDAVDGAVAGNYEYGPFGETIRMTGPMAKANPFRFSTKYQDDESDLLYYGYRYYKPSTGTWPNRDPLGDKKFYDDYVEGKSDLEVISLLSESLSPTYTFTGNNSINQIDVLGLDRWIILEGKPLHKCVIVELWDKCCNRIGYERIEFGPKYKYLGVIYSPGVVTISGANKPSTDEIESTCCDDEALKKWAAQEQANPPGYSLFHYNCDDFANQAIGVKCK